MHLTPQEADAVEARIARVEAGSGVDVVTAVVGRSDAYPEVVWKAFALGVALGALVVVGVDLARPDWVTAHSTWLGVVPMLAAGLLSMVVAMTVPEYARRFLDGVRQADEVRQCAQAMFLERKLFRTRSRCGVLILASVFERRVEIVADIGFDGRVDAAQWRTLVEAMEPALAHARPAVAFLRALDRLEALLAERGFERKGGAAREGELPDRPVDLDGAR